ncbi:MAG: oxidoreductase [Cyanobacteria bacterium NC_groundwater_1444_Ag_S-0.65um_54_12]|nr:oxidoreductase [Cyanobacteria bacterium NC_groundwater_1444_Ag_S-0.65um_54_12]
MGKKLGPKIAVWKFASCDGCQLSLLDCEDELLSLAAVIRIAYFPEATSAELAPPYDISLVEGSITTAHDSARIQQVRESSQLLVAMGACATAGGIQALRNFSHVEEFAAKVYAHPEYLEHRSIDLAHSPPALRAAGDPLCGQDRLSGAPGILNRATAIAEHVPVDYELRGCPINKRQLLEVLNALLNGRRPEIPTHSLCLECKLQGVSCVMVSHGIPCLGPVTQAGCGALCPAYQRGCYGCFGPSESPNTAALSEALLQIGWQRADVMRAFRSFNAAAAAFRQAGEAYAR